MPRKSAKQTVGGIIAVAIVIAIMALIALFNFIVENPWILLLLAGIVIFVIWFNNREKKLQEQKALEEKELQEQKLQEFLVQREKEEKEKEEKRVQEILLHKGEWGDEMCQWLIGNRIDPYIPSTIEIMNRLQEWGQDTSKDLLNRRISIGMTVEMVKLAIGEPIDVDHKEITIKDEKYRYIYGVPRQGATYIWFKNGKVTKIKQ